MATFQNGNVRSATANTVTSMKRSAAHRQCPKCGRKSALIRDVEWRQTACRWGAQLGRDGKPMCDYSYQWDER